jgi:hypothetical protein
MSFSTFQARKDEVIRIADDMAAAACAMNTQNYEVLLRCRNELIQAMDIWILEDMATETVLENIKKQVNDYVTE